MLNTGVGPTINHKQKQPSYLQKKSSNPLSFPRYPMYQSNSQYRLPMSNMPLQTNTLNLPRNPKDIGSMPNMQQPNSSMKMDNFGGPIVKKLDSPYVMDKDIPLSPSSGKLIASRRETEARGDQLGSNLQIPENIMSMASPVQSLGENKAAPGMMMKMNDRDLSKASDITTLSLKVGNLNFRNCKIITKIHYGKRQMTWEVSDIKPAGPGNLEKTPSKRKFEAQFNDIERIDLNTVRNSLVIETREKPQEYKEYNTISKKSTQWLKESNDSESDMNEDIISVNGRFFIEAVYPKDSFTKNLAGKLSQLDKLMRSGLPLTINGKPPDFSAETPNKGMSLLPGDESFQSQITPQRPGKNNFSQMLRSGAPNDDMRFPSLDLTQSINIRPGMNMRGGPSMFQSDFMQILHSESENMMDEPMQKEAPGGEGEEEEEDDDEKEFPPLTKEKKIEIRKFEAQLKTMKPEEKADIILETIKPKRFGINPNSKKIYKCPIYKCNCQKHNPSLLKSHLSQKHKKLVDMGFGIDDSGLFTWKPEAIDFVLMVTKMYPRFVKNIVRETKLM